LSLSSLWLKVAMWWAWWGEGHEVTVAVNVDMNVVVVGMDVDVVDVVETSMVE
jgi:hypothetical protein